MESSTNAPLINKMPSPQADSVFYLNYLLLVLNQDSLSSCIPANYCSECFSYITCRQHGAAVGDFGSYISSLGFTVYGVSGAADGEHHSGVTLVRVTVRAASSHTTSAPRISPQITHGYIGAIVLDVRSYVHNFGYSALIVDVGTDAELAAANGLTGSRSYTVCRNYSGR